MFATAVAAIAGLYLCAGMLALAPRKPGYSHIRHTISELGETGARDQRLVAFGVFLPVGLLLLAVAGLVRADSTPVAALASCIAVGYLGAALFPCDPGSPVSGSARQAAHNLAGAVEYIGGGFALTAIARDSGQSFQVAGFVVLAAAIALSVLPAASLRGGVQRVAELCLFGGLAFALWRGAAG